MELVYFEASIVKTDEKRGYGERRNKDLPKIVPSIIHRDDKVIRERSLSEPVLLLMHLLFSHYFVKPRIFFNSVVDFFFLQYIGDIP